MTDTGDADTRVAWLSIAGDADVWHSIGLTVDTDGTIPLHGTSLRIVSDPDRTGIVGWSIAGAASAGATEIDGLRTEWVEPTQPVWAAHDIGATGLDHVVVLTDSIERTSAAIHAATGCELKRIRDLGSMRQGFHRIGRGGLIVELVERPELDADTTEFWGVVVDVDDLDPVHERLGPDRIGTPKNAVQPGRRIATIRESVGLGLPVALMDSRATD
ncbi:MAG: hypothetical protein AAFY28_16960 [Actinomycetota bacterium]